MSQTIKTAPQLKDAANKAILSVKHNTGTAPELTLKAVYKSRHTRQLITIVNPSKGHLQRLAMTGHDLVLQYFRDDLLVKEEKRFY